MTPPSRDAFVDRLRDLDAAELARFVADLHAHRGRETDETGADRRDGGTRVTVRIPRGERVETRTLAVASGRPYGTSDADAVVTGRPVDRDTLDDGTPVVDAAALHRMAVYAPERDRLAPLLRRHFGGDAFADPDADDATRVPSQIPRDGRSLVVAAALLVAVAAVAANGVSFVPWEAADGGGEGARTADVTTAPPTAGARETNTSANAVACPSPPSGVHPAVLRPVPADAAARSDSTGGGSVRPRTSLSSRDEPSDRRRTSPSSATG